MCTRQLANTKKVAEPDMENPGGPSGPQPIKGRLGEQLAPLSESSAGLIGLKTAARSEGPSQRVMNCLLKTLTT